MTDIELTKEAREIIANGCGCGRDCETNGEGYCGCQDDAEKIIALVRKNDDPFS